MRYCPNCGAKLSEGVTRCWNQECGLVFDAPNKVDDLTIPVPTSPKSDKLRELELEYKLATRGLQVGMISGVFAIISALLVIVLALTLVNIQMVPIFTGTQLVIIVGIVATAVIIYFAFIFGRAASSKARIDKEKNGIEFGSREKS